MHREFDIVSKTHGTHTVFIDEEKWEEVSQYTWSLRKKCNTYYAKTQINHPDGGWLYCPRNGQRRRKTTLQLHTLVMPCPKGKQIDHINGNGLDNRKDNLHVVDPRQNSQNTQISKLNTSGYKGVSWYRQHGKWLAKINDRGRRYFLGYFDSIIEAAETYDKAVCEYHDLINLERQLNFPELYNEYMVELGYDEYMADLEKIT